MQVNYCPVCKSARGGFVYCPTCGGRTEKLSLDSVPGLESLPLIVPLSSNSSRLAMWCHLGPLLIGIASILLAFIAVGFVLIFFAWIPPTVIRSKNRDDEFVKLHADEALNFQVFWIIALFFGLLLYLIAGILTFGIGLVVGAVVGVLAFLPFCLFLLVCQIRGANAASNGKTFRYPLLPLRLVKDLNEKH